MKRQFHTILTVGLSLMLGAVAFGQDSRVARPRPTAQPTRNNNVVQPKPTVPAPPKTPSKPAIADSRPSGNGYGGGLAGNGLQGGFGGVGRGSESYGEGNYGTGGAVTGKRKSAGGSVTGGSLEPVKSGLSADDRRRLLEQLYRDRGSPQYRKLPQFYGDYERMLDAPLFQFPKELSLWGKICPPISEAEKLFKFFGYGWQLGELAWGETISGHKVDRAEAAAEMVINTGFALFKRAWSNWFSPPPPD